MRIKVLDWSKRNKFSGNIIFSTNGKLHRANGPAVVDPDGTKDWYSYGIRHRVDGPAIEQPVNNFELFLCLGILHHINLPTLTEKRNSEYWVEEHWVEGKLHRVGGPAKEDSNGDNEYWVNGKQIKRRGM